MEEKHVTIFFMKRKKSIHFSLTMTIYHMNFMKKFPAVLFDSKNLITDQLIFGSPDFTWSLQTDSFYVKSKQRETISLQNKEI